MKLIDKAAVVTEIERRIQFFTEESGNSNSDIVIALFGLKSFLDTLEVKEVDFSSVSENLAEAEEYLGYTHTSNLAHNKPMVSARLKRAIKELYNAGLFQLTHDEKYRIERLGLKAQKGK